MISKVINFVLCSMIALVIFNLAYGFFLLASPPTKAVKANQKFYPIVRFVERDHTFCTGTVVSPTMILTAAHCVLMQGPFGVALVRGSIEIRPSTNQPIGVMATVNYASPQMDQAILVGDFSAFNAKPFIDDPTVLTAIKIKGKAFVSCGYPLGGDLYCSTTVFNTSHDFYWSVSGVLIPGMSGGPTYDANGTVVGINVAVTGDQSLISPIYNISKNRSK